MSLSGFSHLRMNEEIDIYADVDKVHSNAPDVLDNHQNSDPVKMVALTPLSVDSMVELLFFRSPSMWAI